MNGALALANRGALHCYESVYLQIAAKMPGEGFRGEQYLTDGGEVRQLRWGPNALDFEVRTGDATVLVVNQNFDPGWTLVEPKGRTFSRDGVLAAELPAGVAGERNTTWSRSPPASASRRADQRTTR